MIPRRTCSSAYQMGMAVFHALDEEVTVEVLRELLDLPGAGKG